MPNPSQLPNLQTFDPSGDSSAGARKTQGSRTSMGVVPTPEQNLHRMGPYNPAAALPPKVAKKVLALEFVEMSELRADIWPDDTVPTESSPGPRRPSKPPVTNVRTWLECYGRMAALLCTRFPEKAAELWAYQTSILHAAHAYEGANWVAYDRLYRREMLAKKDLNWSMPNPRLYSEAFTGRAKRHPQCRHCLSEDHPAASCPHNPNPPFVGWFQSPPQVGLTPATPTLQAPPSRPPAEVCRSFNNNRCRFSRCRFLHVCSECGGPHAVLYCPARPGGPTGRGGPPRFRSPSQSRPNRPQPYPAPANQGSD